MTNRNAYPNAMRCGTFLSPLLGVPLRPSTPRLSTLLSASQRFVFYFLSPLRSAALRTPLYSTLLNDLFVTTRRIDTRLSAPQLNDLFITSPLPSPLRNATRLNDLFIHPATQLSSTLRLAPRLYSTICLLSTPLYALLRNSSLLNSTICLLRRSETPRGSAQRNTTPLNATQLNLNQPTNRRT